MNDRKLSNIDKRKIQNHISWIQTLLRPYGKFEHNKYVYPEELSLCKDTVDYLDQLINDVLVEFHQTNCSEITKECPTLAKELATDDERFDIDRVVAKLMMLPSDLANCGYSYVRCIVSSTFHNNIFVLDWPIDPQGFNAIQTYTRMKNYIYDKFPENITHEWLMEHGFTLF